VSVFSGVCVCFVVLFSGVSRLRVFVTARCVSFVCCVWRVCVCVCVCLNRLLRVCNWLTVVFVKVFALCL
jgi:hypothetical protein